MVAPYEAAMGETALLLPLSLVFALFSQRFKEHSADGDSIQKEFAGLLYLLTQLGYSCVASTPLFDTVFAGYIRNLT